MKNKFSVVIPTMWYSNKITTMLDVYESTGLIDEVIIIDNNPSQSIKTKKYSKVKKHTRGENIFVNPAWNWGVALSKNNNIILANDDVVIKRLPELLTALLNCEYELVGVDYQNTRVDSTIKITDCNKKEYGYGCFMYVRKDKYITLPYDMKIWRGDFFLQKHLNKGCFSGVFVDTEMSTTVNKLKGEAKKDSFLYRTWQIGINNQPKDVCVIIYCKNNVDVVDDCITSLIRNTSSNYFVIIVDNLSDDTTRSYLERLDKSRIMLLFNEEELSYEQNMRNAIKLSPISNKYFVCSGDYIFKDNWIKTEQLIDFADIKELKYS